MTDELLFTLLKSIIIPVACILVIAFFIWLIMWDNERRWNRNFRIKCELQQCEMELRTKMITDRMKINMDRLKELKKND